MAFDVTFLIFNYLEQISLKSYRFEHEIYQLYDKVRFFIPRCLLILMQSFFFTCVLYINLH